MFFLWAWLPDLDKWMNEWTNENAAIYGMRVYCHRAYLDTAHASLRWNARRYDEFMRDVATAVATAGRTADRAGADRVETFVDEWAARPVIMNSLRDRISSAGRPAERSAYYTWARVTSIACDLHCSNVCSFRISVSYCFVCTTSSFVMSNLLFTSINAKTGGKLRDTECWRCW